MEHRLIKVRTHNTIRKLMLFVSSFAVLLILFNHIFFDTHSPQLLRLGTTSSIENSGLSKILLEQFTKDTGIEVHHIVFGSGKIIKLAQNGDIDSLITHAKKLEQTLIRSGNGIKRREFMTNNFIILGLEEDPAGVQNATDIKQVMKAIYNTQSLFVSRGDESGTNQRERELWQSIGLNTQDFTSDWYIKTGQGMGNSLMIAQQKKAYILSDLATWRAYKNKINMRVLYRDDKALRNVYAIMLVNPQKHKLPNAKQAAIFYEWLLSERGRNVIRSFLLNGERVFFPIP